MAEPPAESGAPRPRQDSAANMSLSLSNQSGADLLRAPGKQGNKASSMKGSSPAQCSPTRLLEDISRLAEQNKQLNEACASMDEDINYLKLREKKIMYLVHLLQSRGYPVQKIYEEELKSVPTNRVQEFLEEKEREYYEREYGGPDDKCDFSFHTDDSFEPIASGPALLPKKPDCVPHLDLEGLPGYETSSEEGEDEGQEHHDYMS